VIWLGDSTSHGGKVISASALMQVHGIAVALEGDMAYCPKCKGDYAILPSGKGKQHLGRWLAYAGTQTACGAVLMSTF
jgi:uncharacterized Zn-binding protein involved in type VI secretion